MDCNATKVSKSEHTMSRSFDVSTVVKYSKADAGDEGIATRTMLLVVASAVLIADSWL